MKITVDVDVSPQELRAFFGLPNVEPLQQEMLDIVRRNMAAGMEGFDPVALLKPWLPQHLQSVDALQRMWQQFQTGQSPQGESKTGE
jgi:Family of unknown function (DUF6489)